MLKEIHLVFSPALLLEFILITVKSYKLYYCEQKIMYQPTTYCVKY